MATVTSREDTKTNLLPLHEGGIASHYITTFSVASGLANDGDDITVVQLPANLRIVDCTLSVSATLGTSCTAQLRQGSTALTPATTAGGASTVKGNAFPVTTDGTDKVNVLIAGANIGATATVSVHVEYVRI